jgi:hypothetical protein
MQRKQAARAQVVSADVRTPQSLALPAFGTPLTSLGAMCIRTERADPCRKRAVRDLDRFKDGTRLVVSVLRE